MKFKRTLELSLSLAKADFKLKSEGTYLGIFWYLLSPLLTFLLLLVIFSNRLGNNIPYYPLYLLSGVVMFNYFLKVTSESVNTIRNNSGIIKSVNFPRESLIISNSIKYIFSHIFEILILIILLIFLGVSPKMMIFYPSILFFLFIFTIGFSLILSSISVFFFDLEEIWAFTSKLMWFATPIFYSIGGQQKLLLINLFNPMYYFITLSREVIIYNKIPELWLILGAIGYSLLFLILGLFIFNKLKYKFSELI